MSFAELIKLKQQLGTKTYNEAMFGEGTSKPIKKPQRAAFKRENKNRPRETTAKKQVPLLGRTKSKKLDTNQVRDPRFDDKCGEYDRKKFKEDYGFVSEIRENELVELKKQLKEKSLAVEEKKKIKLLIQRLNNKLVEEKKTKQKDMAKTEAEQTVKAARKKGQTPFYASKRKLICFCPCYLRRRNYYHYQTVPFLLQVNEEHKNWSSNM